MLERAGVRRREKQNENEKGEETDSKTYGNRKENEMKFSSE
jgi:hypothetical protein